MRAGKTGHLVLSVLLVTGLSACIQLPTGTPTATNDGPPASLPEQLLAMDEATYESMSTRRDELPLAFLAMDRSTYCVIGPKQGAVFQNPVDPLMGSGEKDDTKLEVKAVYCEFAQYPAPEKVTDDCNGTNLGFKGGTVMLTAEEVIYGGCRVGVTAMEAEFGPGATPSDGPVASLPVLREGYAIEAGGYRCGDNGEGMICLELTSGLGFHVGEDKYRTFGKTTTK